MIKTTFLLDANDIPLHAVQPEANRMSNSSIVGLITILLIVAIIVIAVGVQINKIYKKKRTRKSNFSKPEHNPSYDLVTNEVISLLEILPAFLKKGSRYFDREGKCIFITPVDLHGNKFGYHSDLKAEYIQIELVIFEKFPDEYWYFIEEDVSKPTGINDYFILKKGDESTSYTATIFRKFDDDYRNYIIYLYYAVVQRFPELNVTCDGSFIHIDMCSFNTTTERR